MKLKISQEIIDQAVNCKYDFGCMKEDKFVLCRVERSLNNAEVLFIKPDENRKKHCSALQFGGSMISTCPIRKEIYRKYKI